MAATAMAPLLPMRRAVQAEECLEGVRFVWCGDGYRLGLYALAQDQAIRHNSLNKCGGLRRNPESQNLPSVFGFL